MCDVVQTNWLLCHLGKDYEIKSVLTSSDLESYNTYKVRFLLSPNIYLNSLFSQVNETPENFNCLVKLRVAQGLINALYMIK